MQEAAQERRVRGEEGRLALLHQAGLLPAVDGRHQGGVLQQVHDAERETVSVLVQYVFHNGRGGRERVRGQER